MRANHKLVRRQLNIAKGQLEGIIKMVDDDRYCLDIYDQINATRAILNKINNTILEEHMRMCVKEAIKNGDDSKIEEVIKAINRKK